jgi:hypothetical protein
MGNHVKRLTLIDAEKFNSLMELLEEAELVHSYKDMMSSVENKSSLAGTDIVNYLNKKRKFKDSLVPSLPATLAPPPTAAPLNIKPSTVAESEKRIAEFLKTRGITSSENGIKTGKDKSLPIAYQDMIYDLTQI